MTRPYLPEPLPDEVLDGWLGRCSVIHSCPSTDNLVAGLRASIGLGGTSTALEVIAASLGMPLQEVLFRHTTLPAQRAFSARPVGVEKRGAEKLTPYGVSRRSDGEALACTQCAREDAARGQQGYWRRTHHLPGVDWCPTHREALVSFSPGAFAKRPADALAEARGTTCALPETIDRSRVLGRYTDLLVRWLQRTSAYSCAALHQVVSDGCTSKGLRCSQAGRRPLVSDLVKQSVPADWLALHWPEVLAKPAATYLPRLDGPSKDKHVGYPGATCALVLATLFESVDDVERRLGAVDAQVRAEYDSRTNNSLLAARRDFVKGSSLEAACKAHGVAVETLERWLRETAKLWTSTTDQVPKASASQTAASLHAA